MRRCLNQRCKSSIHFCEFHRAEKDSGDREVDCDMCGQKHILTADGDWGKASRLTVGQVFCLMMLVGILGLCLGIIVVRWSL